MTRGCLKSGLRYTLRMKRTIYARDLTDEAWRGLAPFIPPAKCGGRPRTTNRRQGLDAIFSLLRSGCAWRLLPHDVPRGQTVSDSCRTWRVSGGWAQITPTGRQRLRQAAGREQEPRAALMARQSVTTTARGGGHGYEGGQHINGRKRHLVVDPTGLV
jgi:putative transposase